MFDPIWICRDGRRLKPGQMSNDHLHNCIAKIRSTGWRQQWLARLELELIIRKVSKWLSTPPKF